MTRCDLFQECKLDLTFKNIEGELGPPELVFPPQTPVHPAVEAAAASQIQVWPWASAGQRGLLEEKPHPRLALPPSWP